MTSRMEAKRAGLVVISRGKGGGRGSDCGCARALPKVGMSRLTGTVRGVGTIADCGACGIRWTFMGGVSGRMYTHPGRSGWMSDSTVGGRWVSKKIPK